MPTAGECSPAQVSAAAFCDALRELTANLLRVTRGAGRPEDILLQTTTLMASFAAYREARGSYPPADEIATALRLESVPDGADEGWSEWDGAVRVMVRGALQIAAADLLSQPPQARAGRKELFAGYRRIEKLHGKQLRRLLWRW